MANHPIVHVEIPADDVRKAGEFYSSVFDWKMELETNFDYLMFQAEGGPGGGFVKTGEEVEGTMAKVDSLLMHIGTDDVEGTLARINAKGGKTIVPDTEIPGIGSFAIFMDPTGNRVGLFRGLPNQ